MKLIKVSGSYFVQVDDWRYDELNAFTWYIHKTKGRNIYYAARKILIRKGVWRIILMHRQVLGLKYKEGKIVDHKDRDGLNCQEYNLRIATFSQNQANTVSVKNSSSKFMGVFWGVSKREYKSKKTGEIKTYSSASWRVALSHNSKTIYLGSFKTEKEAALAYNEGAKKYHGEFARPNIL